MRTGLSGRRRQCPWTKSIRVRALHLLHWGPAWRWVTCSSTSLTSSRSWLPASRTHLRETVGDHRSTVDVLGLEGERLSAVTLPGCPDRRRDLLAGPHQQEPGEP